MHAKTDGRKEITLKFHSFPPGEVALALKFFPTFCDLIRKSRTLKKRTHLDMTCNSQIAKFFPSQVGILIRKQPFDIRKTLR